MLMYTINPPVWQDDWSGPLVAYVRIHPMLTVGYAKHYKGWKVMLLYECHHIQRMYLHRQCETEEEAKAITEKYYYDYVRHYLKEVIVEIKTVEK